MSEIFGMNIFAISALLNFILSAFLGIIVFFRNPRKQLYFSFLLLNIAIAIWSFGYFFWQTSDQYGVALFWVQVLTVGSNLVPPTMLHWAFALLNLHKKRKALIILVYLISFICTLFVATGFVIKGLAPNS